MIISLSEQFNTPIQNVFNLFIDVEKSPEVISAIKKVEILEGVNPVQVGSKWKETRTIFGKEAVETMWVTELEQNKKYTVEAKSNGTRYYTRHTFTEENGITTVTIEFESHPESFFAKILSPLGRLMVGSTKKMFAQDLKEMKEYLN